jgi:hypothetical protein
VAARTRTRRQPVSSRVACYGPLKKTGGNSDGDALLAAMKGMAWDSPRGPISIDPQTRDIVQNIYIRKVEKVNGQLYKTEFATYEAVNDPMKAGPKRPRYVRNWRRTILAREKGTLFSFARRSETLALGSCCLLFEPHDRGEFINWDARDVDGVLNGACVSITYRHTTGDDLGLVDG